MRRMKRMADTTPRSLERFILERLQARLERHIGGEYDPDVSRKLDALQVLLEE